MNVHVSKVQMTKVSLISLVPRPHPASRHLQYEKAGEGPGVIYHVSDVGVERRVERT